MLTIKASMLGRKHPKFAESFLTEDDFLQEFPYHDKTSREEAIDEARGQLALQASLGAHKEQMATLADTGHAIVLIDRLTLDWAFQRKREEQRCQKAGHVYEEVAV